MQYCRMGFALKERRYHLKPSPILTGSFFSSLFFHIYTMACFSTIFVGECVLWTAAVATDAGESPQASSPDLRAGGGARQSRSPPPLKPAWLSTAVPIKANSTLKSWSGVRWAQNLYCQPPPDHIPTQPRINSITVTPPPCFRKPHSDLSSGIEWACELVYALSNRWSRERRPITCNF